MTVQVNTPQKKDQMENVLAVGKFAYDIKNMKNNGGKSVSTSAMQRRLQKMDETPEDESNNIYSTQYTTGSGGKKRPY